MDQERASSILFLSFLIFLLPFPLYSLHGNEDSASNKSLPLSSVATVFFSFLDPCQAVQANSSISFSTEVSFSVHGSNNGGLVTAAVFYKERNRTLTVSLLHTRKWIKKPHLSTKFNLERHFQPKNYGKKDIAVGICTPLLALISIISAAFAFLKKLFTSKKANPQTPSPEAPAPSPDSIISNLLVGFQKFTYSELCAATKAFHHSELLGRGIYAAVYRAIFPGSNTIYAVKRFKQNDSSKTSFQIEVTAIRRLRHDKILELRGWCNENPNDALLVFDYMPHRSLEEALRNRRQPLLWPQRYKIAVGVAKALVYLHEECLPMVIHGDIKEGNVMLDADFNPKLGDFGLAMSVPPYILWRGRTEQDPPECELDAEVTEKLDVYLYGSMVLGLCCRRTDRLNIFLKLLRRMKLRGKLLDAVDDRLGGNYDEEEMLRLLNVGLLCLEEEIHERPSMKQVLRLLTSEGGHRRT